MCELNSDPVVIMAETLPSMARNDIWNPLPFELFPLATKSTQRLREWPVKMTGSSCDRHVSKITPVLGLSGMGNHLGLHLQGDPSHW